MEQEELISGNLKQLWQNKSWQAEGGKLVITFEAELKSLKDVTK